MIAFVENSETLEHFKEEYFNKKSIIFPLYKNRIIHPMYNQLVGALVFIKDTTWVLMQSHNDCAPIDISVLSNSEEEKFIFDTKWILHNLYLPNYKSIDVSHHLMEMGKYEYDTLYHKFYSGYTEKHDTTFIPITKIIEYVTDFVQSNHTYARTDVPGFDMYNDVIMKEFLKIERNGIPVIDGNEYSLYNNFITTGRPTNAFNGINYSALNKSDGSRDRFVSKNGEFYQYDFDGYHIRLIAKLIREPVPVTSAHEWLGEQYFGKKDLTREEYEMSKSITFKQLYGGVYDEFKDIPFFKKTDEYINAFYKNFIINGYIETKFGKRIPHSSIDNHNPQKVFNYFLQSLETEVNILAMKRINHLLEGTKTKLVLYLYDSFLFDVHPSEINIINDISRILNEIAPTKLSKNSIYGKI